jgi:hypothetical protein
MTAGQWISSATSLILDAMIQLYGVSSLQDEKT